MRDTRMAQALEKAGVVNEARKPLITVRRLKVNRRPTKARSRTGTVNTRTTLPVT